MGCWFIMTLKTKLPTASTRKLSVMETFCFPLEGLYGEAVYKLHTESCILQKNAMWKQVTLIWGKLYVHFQRYESNPVDCRLLLQTIHSNVWKIRSCTTQSSRSREITFIFTPFTKLLQSLLFAFERKKRKGKIERPELQHLQ